jgi:hypothetical protein
MSLIILFSLQNDTRRKRRTLYSVYWRLSSLLPFGGLKALLLGLQGLYQNIRDYNGGRYVYLSVFPFLFFFCSCVDSFFFSRGIYIIDWAVKSISLFCWDSKVVTFMMWTPHRVSFVEMFLFSNFIQLLFLPLK